jgi:hypothetical protein
VDVVALLVEYLIVIDLEASKAPLPDGPLVESHLLTKLGALSFHQHMLQFYAR